MWCELQNKTKKKMLSGILPLFCIDRISKQFPKEILWGMKNNRLLFRNLSRQTFNLLTSQNNIVVCKAYLFRGKWIIDYICWTNNCLKFSKYFFTDRFKKINNEVTEDIPQDLFLEQPNILYTLHGTTFLILFDMSSLRPGAAETDMMKLL